MKQLAVVPAFIGFVACSANLPPASFAARNNLVEPSTSSVADRSFAMSNHPLLYVVNVSPSTVTAYNPRLRNPKPVMKISDGLLFPIADCVDREGTLYVTNDPGASSGWISVYRAGQRHPFETITQGVGSPAFCAIDGKGNLWVTNIWVNPSGPNVTEYKKGTTKPLRTITDGVTFPVGLAIDHLGNIYVGNGGDGSAKNVQVYGPGGKSPTRTITDGVTSPVGLGVDSKNTLYVTNDLENNVAEYRAGEQDPFQTIVDDMDSPVGATFDQKDKLYVTNENDVILEFAPGSLVPLKKKITRGLDAPEGSAPYPPALP